MVVTHESGEMVDALTHYLAGYQLLSLSKNLLFSELFLSNFDSKLVSYHLKFIYTSLKLDFNTKKSQIHNQRFCPNVFAKIDPSTHLF